MNFGITCRIWKSYKPAADHEPTGAEAKLRPLDGVSRDPNEMINKINAIISLISITKNAKIFVAAEI